MSSNQQPGKLHAGCVCRWIGAISGLAGPGHVVTESPRHTTHCSPNIHTERSQGGGEEEEKNKQTFYVTKLRGGGETEESELLCEQSYSYVG